LIFGGKELEDGHTVGVHSIQKGLSPTKMTKNGVESPCFFGFFD